MARGGGRRVSSPSVKGTEENMEENSKRSGREVVAALWRVGGQRAARAMRKASGSLDDDEAEVGRWRSSLAVLGDGLVDVEEGLVGVFDELGKGRSLGGRGRVEGSQHAGNAGSGTAIERRIVTSGDDL